MCRNIRVLYNFVPPSSDAEIDAAALQFVRKISGFSKPSQANEAAFARAVTEVSSSAKQLLASLQTSAQPRDRAAWAAAAKRRSTRRFSTPAP